MILAGFYLCAVHCVHFAAYVEMRRVENNPQGSMDELACIFNQ